METFNKNHIGNGRKIIGSTAIKVTCSIEELLKYAHLSGDKEVVSFEIDLMENPVDFFITHVVYVKTPEESEANRIEKEINEKRIQKLINTDIQFIDSPPF